MTSKSLGFYAASIPLLFLSISSASLTQADSDYPRMNRGDHRSMMGYGYGQGRYTEERESHEAMRYGHRGMGMDRMEYGLMGSGMMGFGHMGSGMKGDTWAIMQLDLSDSQKKKVRDIHRQHRRENWNRMGEMMEHQDKLAELYDANTPDPKAIGEVYAAMFDIMRKKIESRIQAQNKAQALLTNEQQKALDKELKKSRQYRQYNYRH